MLNRVLTGCRRFNPRLAVVVDCHTCCCAAPGSARRDHSPAMGCSVVNSALAPRSAARCSAQVLAQWERVKDQERWGAAWGLQVGITIAMHLQPRGAFGRLLMRESGERSEPYILNTEPSSGIFECFGCAGMPWDAESPCNTYPSYHRLFLPAGNGRGGPRRAGARGLHGHHLPARPAACTFLPEVRCCFATPKRIDVMCQSTGCPAYCWLQ